MVHLDKGQIIQEVPVLKDLVEVVASMEEAHANSAQVQEAQVT